MGVADLFLLERLLLAEGDVLSSRVLREVSPDTIPFRRLTKFSADASICSYKTASSILIVIYPVAT